MKKAVTIGTFDGVHRGHKLVLDTLKKEATARGLQPIAFSFDRHPLSLIAPQRAPGDLISTSRKEVLIRKEGVEPIIIPFTETLRAMTAYEWLDHLYRRYGARLLVAGYDNTFGSDGIDLSVADYQAICESVGMELVVAPEVEGVSSSAVRKALRAGDIARANNLLGHRAELEGKVAPGFHVGSGIGFPTANLQPGRGALVPARGVYSALAFVDQETEPYPAMVNIGNRPTFDGTPAASMHSTVEAHLIGLVGDIYGSPLRLEFSERLRDEMKFDNVDDLRAQLEKDKTATLASCREA